MVVEWHSETPLAKGGVYTNDYCWVLRVKGEKLPIELRVTIRSVQFVLTRPFIPPKQS